MKGTLKCPLRPQVGRGRQAAARSVPPRQAAMARGDTKLAALQQALAGPRVCGVDSRALEDLPHGRRRELVSQADQFAVDAPVAPARVVSDHSQHQRPYGPRDPGPPVDGARIRPVPPDQAGVPAQQGRAETISRIGLPTCWHACDTFAGVGPPARCPRRVPRIAARGSRRAAVAYERTFELELSMRQRRVGRATGCYDHESGGPRRTGTAFCAASTPSPPALPAARLGPDLGQGFRVEPVRASYAPGSRGRGDLPAGTWG